MPRPVILPGARDVRGRLDEASANGSEPDAAVVACPPHPEQGGSRSDPRLRAVADALGERGVDCLRFDYGPWDEGVGERADARDAVAWATERYDAVGLFGYSFGASVAVLAAADLDLRALSALAPTARLAPDLDAVAALDRIDCPAQVIVGERDDTVDWEPVAERAAELGHAVERLPADHFFVGRHDRVGELAAAFLASELRETS
ncbi:alpha/beta hydrolase [Natronoarchaeum mannanilyticum]|uniref:alpha/beta hydrolase n=1 Tax=Natronoarchaeum mannanilyticum TaxID=926360 RepID=UPI0031E378F8